MGEYSSLNFTSRRFRVMSSCMYEIGLLLIDRESCPSLDAPEGMTLLRLLVAQFLNVSAPAFIKSKIGSIADVEDPVGWA